MFDCFAHLVKLFQLLIDLMAACFSDFLLASRACHEGEGDLQSAPPVLEQLEHAVFVENMATAKLDARFVFQVACVADCAQLILVD